MSQCRRFRHIVLQVKVAANHHHIGLADRNRQEGAAFAVPDQDTACQREIKAILTQSELHGIVVDYRQLSLIPMAVLPRCCTLAGLMKQGARSHCSHYDNA